MVGIPRHLIALDLDGTLLNSDKKISKSTLTYLRKLKKDHTIILATGRPYRSFIQYHQQLGLTTPMVCLNGAYITNPTDSKFKTKTFTFAQKVVKNIYQKIGKDSLENVMCETNEDIWLLKEEKNLASFFWHDNMNIIYGPLTETLNKDPMTMILKLNIRSKKQDQRIISIIEKEFGLRTRFWGKSTFCEIYDEKISKGSALLEIIQNMKLDRQHFIGFGDAENDKEMLLFANHSFVMKNAEKSMKKYGKSITKKDNNHDGIVDELQRYFNRLSSVK
jgi:Cof subfamily protein (haloacid dehalogenase superfamily)